MTNKELIETAALCVSRATEVLELMRKQDANGDALKHAHECSKILREASAALTELEVRARMRTMRVVAV